MQGSSQATFTWTTGAKNSIRDIIEQTHIKGRSVPSFSILYLLVNSQLLTTEVCVDDLIGAAVHANWSSSCISTKTVLYSVLCGS